MVWVSLFWSCVLQGRAPHYTPSILALVIWLVLGTCWEFKTEFYGHQSLRRRRRRRRRRGDCISTAYLGEFCGFVHHGDYYTEIPGAIDLEHSAGPNQAVFHKAVLSYFGPRSFFFLKCVLLGMADKREALQQCTKQMRRFWTGEMQLISLTARRRLSPFLFFLVLGFGVGPRGHRRALAGPC